MIGRVGQQSARPGRRSGRRRGRCRGRCSRAPSSSTTRVLPMPAGPSTRTVPSRWPATISSTSDSSRASSSSRPTRRRLAERLPPTSAADVMAVEYGPRDGVGGSALGRDGQWPSCTGTTLVGDQAVGLAVDPARGLGVGRLDQAEHLPGALVEPVLLVVDAVGALDLEVAGVGSGDGLGGEPVDLLVDVHEQRHVVLLVLVVGSDHQPVRQPRWRTYVEPRRSPRKPEPLSPRRPAPARRRRRSSVADSSTVNLSLPVILPVLRRSSAASSAARTSASGPVIRTLVSSWRIETLACDLAPRMPISAAATASSVAGSAAAAAPRSVSVGQAAPVDRALLPPRPDLLGHVGQERREQPELDLQRDRERGAGRGGGGPTRPRRTRAP